MPVQGVDEIRSLQSRNQQVMFEKWKCPVPPACIFLRRRVFRQPARNDTFPLVRLPPEIRVMVFEYALRLPASGVALDCLKLSRPGLGDSKRSKPPYL